jgi:hypothetical protein
VFNIALTVMKIPRSTLGRLVKRVGFISIRLVYLMLNLHIVNDFGILYQKFLITRSDGLYRLPIFYRR